MQENEKTPSPLKVLAYKCVSQHETKKSKVAYFADSIGLNADLSTLEVGLNAEITARKAYGSSANTWIYGQKHTWSRELNFKSVVPKTLASMPQVDHIVFHCSSTDITNSPLGQSELYYQARAMISSCNMVRLAVETVGKNPSLKTLVLVERAPRFHEFGEISAFANAYLATCLEEEMKKSKSCLSKIKLVKHCVLEEVQISDPACSRCSRCSVQYAVCSRGGR